MKIREQPYGRLADGTEVALYTLVNDQGIKAVITNYGGIVVSLYTPDRDGNLADVVLGFDTLDEYVAHNPFFGCLVGRFGNRIANARNRSPITIGELNNAHRRLLHPGQHIGPGRVAALKANDLAEFLQCGLELLFGLLLSVAAFLNTINKYIAFMVTELFHSSVISTLTAC